MQCYRLAWRGSLFCAGLFLASDGGEKKKSKKNIKKILWIKK